ncbi:MAG: host attachment protein [Bdellovibrionota bacterium]
MGKVTVPKGFDPKFVRHWYLVANRIEALIYEGDLNGKFRFVKRHRNPRGKLMEQELVADKSGRSFSSARGSGIRHGFEPRSNYHEEVAIQFARKIAMALDRAALEQELSDLVVLAEPHFLGLLNQEFTKRVNELIRKEVPREWAEGSDQDLHLYLQKKLA